LDYDLDPNSYDRIIVYTQTTGAEAPNPAPTSTAGHTCQTYVDSKWLEVIPTAVINQNNAYNLDFTNYKNVPYVIPTGVVWHIAVWKDSDVVHKITYQATAVATPHDLANPPTLNTFNLKIRAITTVEITIEPFNDIPQGGSIEIIVPNTYQFIGPKCDVTVLVDYSCTLQSDGDLANTDPKSILLTGF